MAVLDLVTLDQVQAQLPRLTAEQLPAIPALISAASILIAGSYPRAEAPTLRDEQYEVNTDRTIALMKKPVVRVQRLCVDMTSVMTIDHAPGIQGAWVELLTNGDDDAPTPTGLLLTATDGTNQTIDFGTYPTIQQAADQINTLAGWTAIVEPDRGFVPCVDCPPVQGRKSCINVPMIVRAWTRDLDDYDVDRLKGFITIFEWRQEGYRFPDRVWGTDSRNARVRVLYTAGRTPGADVQQACVITIKDMLDRTTKTGAFQSEWSPEYAYQMAAAHGIPELARAILSRYRDRSFS